VKQIDRERERARERERELVGLIVEKEWGRGSAREREREREGPEGLLIGDIVDEQDTHGISVVRSCDGFEPLLPRCVQELTERERERDVTHTHET
jgi:hypothetical protein